MAIAQP
jgi:hypothetical protein